MAPSPSAEVVSALQTLETSTAPDKPTQYSALLTKIITSTADPALLTTNLTTYAQSILSDNIGIISSRPLLSAFVQQYKTIPSADVKIEVGNAVIEILAPKVVSYEEQDNELKESVAASYVANEDFTDAAKVLQTISLESSQRAVSSDEKAKVWIRIVRCYLEEEDFVSAMSYLGRVKNVLHEVRDEETKLMFLLSQGRILDSQRQFLEAAAAYHKVSFEAKVDEEERLRALSAAVTCAVLAPAGPQRAKTLTKLYKDERVGQIEEYSMLEKIVRDRLLAPEEIKAFAGNLMDHQKARTADGSTVFDKAIIDHQVLAVSRIYNNISFERLGELLNVTGDQAESYAATMIEQGRLAGSIDQIDMVVRFHGVASGQNKKGHAEKVVGSEMRKYDANIQAFAEEVEKTTTMIGDLHPEWYATQMVR